MGERERGREREKGGRSYIIGERSLPSREMGKFFY